MERLLRLFSMKDLLLAMRHDFIYSGIYFKKSHILFGSQNIIWHRNDNKIVINYKK